MKHSVMRLLAWLRRPRVEIDTQLARIAAQIDDHREQLGELERLADLERRHP